MYIELWSCCYSSTQQRTTLNSGRWQQMTSNNSKDGDAKWHQRFSRRPIKEEVKGRDRRCPTIRERLVKQERQGQYNTRPYNDSHYVSSMSINERLDWSELEKNRLKPFWEIRGKKPGRKDSKAKKVGRSLTKIKDNE